MKVACVDWQQDGNLVWFDYQGQIVYFDMPDGYRVHETHPDVLALAEWLMLSPWHDVPMPSFASRAPGAKTALSFSAGVDSSAAMLMLPDNTELVYCERHGSPLRQLRQDNAFRMIERLEQDDRRVIRVCTNSEMIRMEHGQAVGYSTTLAMGVPMVLLADFLNLGTVCWGKVLDDQFFPHGTLRDYTEAFYQRQELFANAGLTAYYPTVGCSEVITTGIVDASPWRDWAFSCIRGTCGEGCGRCYKCFRTALLRGQLRAISPEVQAALTKNPPKMASSLAWAAQRAGAILPGAEHLNSIDVSMLERYYPPAYESLYTEDVVQWTETALQGQGVLPMTEDETTTLQSVDFRRRE